MKIATGLVATACGVAVAVAVFWLSTASLGRSSPISPAVLLFVAVVFGGPMAVAACGWAVLARDRSAFLGPFSLASIFQIAALGLVVVYFRSPGEALTLDAEWIPWLVAIGCGSAALASAFVMASRVRGLRHNNPLQQTGADGAGS